MLSSKQKAFLSGLAHHLNPVFQIGKEGFSAELMEGITSYLNKHELMKVTILNNSSTTFAEATAVFEGYYIEVVKKIGRVIILYKHSQNVKEPIKLPTSKKK